jgi:hypothetical protein
MRRLRPWFLGLGVAVSGASPAFAQDVVPTAAASAAAASPTVAANDCDHCPRFPLFPWLRPHPTPPSIPYMPFEQKITPEVSPKIEPKIEPKVEPKIEPKTDTTAPPAPSAFTEAPAAGTDISSDSRRPNIFGGPFGGGSSSGLVLVSMPGALTGHGSLIFPSVGPPAPQIANQFGILPVTVAAGTVSGTISSLAQLPGGNSSFDSALKKPNIPIPPPGPIGSGQATALINSLTGKTLPNSLPGAGPLPSGVAGGPNPIFYAAQQAEQTKQSNAVLQSLKVSKAQVAPLSNGPVVFTGDIATTIQVPTAISIANPGSGGVVGRQKMSEDTNPIPRDRLILNYDYFSNVALGTGQNVNRFNMGFEKTFFNRLASIEMRLPFASTMNSDSVTGTSQATNVEIGDLRITQRLLLWNGPLVHLGTGLGMYLPTANATQVSAPDGTPLVRIPNRSVTLSPYLGVLLTPGPRLFTQGWIACDFDTNGDPVLVNTDGTGLQSAGRLQNAANLQLDAQLGYWVYLAPGDRLLTGFAPFIELHYGTPVQSADSVNSGGFLIGGQGAGINELNMTVGAMAILGQRSTLSAGAVFPLTQGNSKEFDFQFGIRANFYFGPSGRSAASIPSTF